MVLVISQHVWKGAGGKKEGMETSSSRDGPASAPLRCESHRALEKRDILIICILCVEVNYNDGKDSHGIMT